MVVFKVNSYLYFSFNKIDENQCLFQKKSGYFNLNYKSTTCILDLFMDM